MIHCYANCDNDYDIDQHGDNLIITMIRMMMMMMMMMIMMIINYNDDYK